MKQFVEVTVDPKSVLHKMEPQELIDYLVYFHPNYFNKYIASLTPKQPEPEKETFYELGQWFKCVDGLFNGTYYTLSEVDGKAYLMSFYGSSGINRWSDRGMEIHNYLVSKKQLLYHTGRLEQHFIAVKQSEAMEAMKKKWN